MIKKKKKKWIQFANRYYAVEEFAVLDGVWIVVRGNQFIDIRICWITHEGISRCPSIEQKSFFRNGTTFNLDSFLVGVSSSPAITFSSKLSKRKFLFFFFEMPAVKERPSLKVFVFAVACVFLISWRLMRCRDVRQIGVEGGNGSWRMRFWSRFKWKIEHLTQLSYKTCNLGSSKCEALGFYFTDHLSMHNR